MKLTQVPIISIKPLASVSGVDSDDVQMTSTLLLNAAKNWGFVYIQDHGVSHELLENLESVSREFFALSLEEKMEIRMLLGGKAWRGYFPPGGELTSGIPDAKEGLYFGSELEKEHPKVQENTPLHGPNLWPTQTKVQKMKDIVLEYIERLTELGHHLMRGLAIGLQLEENYFKKSFGKDPTILFRIFNYPKTDQKEGWGVGEHTDYGFLTILKTDKHSGLQVLSPDQIWIDAPPISDTFIVNLGDQLEIATKGLLKATPHRVKVQREGDRLSWPFFFDPDWEAVLQPIRPQESKVLQAWLESGGNSKRKPGKRWDGQDLHESDGSITYGEYLLKKVSKCFPELFNIVS